MINFDKIKDACSKVVGCDVNVTLSMNNDIGLNEFNFSWTDRLTNYECAIVLTNEFIEFSNIDIHDALAFELERRVMNRSD